MLNENGLSIYTDGSARGNPGRGGYGVLLIWKNTKKELSGGYRLTTNNRMEILSVIVGLEALTRTGLDITIYSDSQYVINSITEGWLENWMRTDFKGGKKNSDLWRRLYPLLKKHRIKMVWVKGHASNPYNNRCDELATQAADGNNLAIDTVYEETQEL
jgi:ribonuclease HI